MEINDMRTDNNKLNNIGGWGFPPDEDEAARCDAEGLSLGRIVRVNRGRYLLAREDGVFEAGVSGDYKYRAADASDFPAVGDWAMFRSGDGGTAVIEHICRRRSCLSRKAAGETTEEQVIAANIDIIFLVFAINGGRNFTAAGLERYLTAAWDSGAQPAVILNKADLCSAEEREKALLTAEASAPGCGIFMVSAETGEGLEMIGAGQGEFRPGTTIALIGPSGVGKSTLINALSGEDLQKTGAQREADLRGRHTTTHRELFRLPSGLLLIDSPGMRELQLWADSGSADDAFADISEIAAGCRFRDCAHQGEPGCAVQQALATGQLEQRRFENYLELKRELDYLHRKQDRKRGKDISLQIKRYYKNRR